MLAVGLMIEDCTPENGPLMVIPGSHRGPIHDHHQDGLFVGGVKSEALGNLPEKAVALTAPAGSISIHHTAMLHASTANQGAKNRPLLLYNYFASDAFPLMATEDWEGFNAKLLRGDVVYQPRYAPMDCKIPLPRPGGASQSIFEVQESLEGGAVLT